MLQMALKAFLIDGVEYLLIPGNSEMLSCNTGFSIIIWNLPLNYVMWEILRHE